MSRQVITDLRATAAYLEEHGWTQFTLGEHGGARCLLGAIYSSAQDPIGVERALELDLPIPNWNDSLRRTRKQVLALLEGAVRRVEAKMAEAEELEQVRQEEARTRRILEQFRPSLQLPTGSWSSLLTGATSPEPSVEAKVLVEA